MIGLPHPYFTQDLPGIGGRFKAELPDFIVEEVPLYHPSDQGEHTFFEVEKTDLSTLEALERIARRLGVSTGQIGFAGLKDRKGITRQWFSVRLVPPEAITSLEIDGIRITWARLHTNKLRTGHLRGNRFRLRVRDVDPRPERVAAIVGRIQHEGMPNYYGPQRFGNRGDAFKVGRALLGRKNEYAVRRLLGFPQPTEHNPNVVEARRRFMAGDFAGAFAEFPGSYRQERRVLGYLIRSSGNFDGAIRQLSEPLRRLYSSAYQSFLYNRVLEARLAASGNSLRKLYVGDLAWIHRSGAVFRVESPEREEPRADVFEISPSGPIFGKKMIQPSGIQAEIEAQVLTNEGLRATDFHRLMPGLHLEGGRRPLRVPLRELEYRLEGADLLLSFFLPKGSYATTFLRELMKNEESPAGAYERDSEELSASVVGETTIPAPTTVSLLTGGSGETALSEGDLEADDEPPFGD